MSLRIATLIALLLGAFFVWDAQPAKASSTEVTPEIINRIRSRCIENQGTLNRLHKTDAFIRNDRGNLYRTIGDKLMVPLNRRIASNQLDGGSLVTITSDYKAEYNRFYKAYIEYDNALSKVLDIDCTREPVTFYTALTDAREKRVKVSESISKLKDHIRAYGVTFSDFKAKYEKEGQ